MTAPTRPRRRSAQSARSSAAATRGRAEREAPEATVAPEVERPRRRQKDGERGSGQRGRTSAAERAYARRAQRADLLRQRAAHPKAQEQRATTGTRLKLRWPRSRASFVVLMMCLLAAGVATTLWLSTQAIADSYRLEQVRKDTAALTERQQQLQRAVAQDESASVLSQHARDLGMVPGGDPARIVVNPDGSTRVVGEPKKANGAAATTSAPPTPAAAAPGSQRGAVPHEGDQPAVPQDDAPAPQQQQQPQQPQPQQGQPANGGQ
ncbi:hypothetical protein [Amycolatopsis sp. CA-230715]|uniref:hypothetical protein n=1 Tax=Amycolatopsis sp. CA-230715 TaxID=2745196 RepID=UPI001C3336F2|nr:hypothetical protein [Amycolatopsis sp. CA-230715]QWF77024.1 hypothetical protein HUW46_00404 [Amycolatopsis sp. CA-230715]